MDDDDGITDLYICFAIETKLMRFIGNTLVPSTIKLNAAVDRTAGAEDNDVEVALAKWRYFMEQVIAKSIAFGVDNVQAMDILLDESGVNRTGNLFLLTPEDPSDELLGTLFQAKFNALGRGHLVAMSIEVESDNFHGLSFTLLGDHSIYLPQTGEEFIGGATFWEKPWWHRDDASSIDVLKPDDEAPTPAWAYSLDFLDRQSAKTPPISHRPAFKPTIIDGGKPDKPKS